MIEPDILPFVAEAERIRIEVLARIAYGRRLVESGQEILELLELLTGIPERRSRGEIDTPRDAIQLGRQVHDGEAKRIP